MINLEFQKEVTNQRYNIISITGDLYILSSKDDPAKTVVLRLICSDPVDSVKYGSHNNNDVEAVGMFKFKLDTKTGKSDFMIFVLPDSEKHTHHYIIIPAKDLKRRINKEKSSGHENNICSIVFWLMPDGCLFDCTDIPIEGEWFFLSKGVNGRMVDGSRWDYTEYLNAWNKLRRI